MRKLKGTITSNKMQKTVVVRVDRLRKHPKYQKYHRVSKKFKAHDGGGEYRAGDEVIIEEIKPVSKDKRWRIASLVKRPVEEVAGQEDVTETSSDEQK